MLKDEILRYAQNDSRGAGQPQATLKNGRLILHYVQDDKGHMVPPSDLDTTLTPTRAVLTPLEQQPYNT
ncbi:MAG TPA: hypothetical protein VFH60_06830, partial [Chloroflexia bacterium]|nr:hypothetical protein [Chloroflexia bacterium]